MYVDQKECWAPEGHGVGPAKPQHKRLCDVHALRAHHWYNVFEQGGGGRSANNLFTDTDRATAQLKWSNKSTFLTIHHYCYDLTKVLWYCKDFPCFLHNFHSWELQTYFFLHTHYFIYPFIICNRLSFWQGFTGTGANPSWHWVRGGFTLDKLPVCHRADTETNNHLRSHSHLQAI